MQKKKKSKISEALLKAALICLELEKKKASLYCFVQTNKPFYKPFCLANFLLIWTEFCIMWISLSVILPLYLDFESFL